jgi:hypothetical protein
MKRFPRKFVAVLLVDASVIFIAVALVLLAHPRFGMTVMAVLFITNILLLPAALKGEVFAPDTLRKGQLALWFFGFAILVSALVGLATMARQEGFALPNVIGVISGFLISALYLYVARKSKGPPQKGG